MNQKLTDFLMTENFDTNLNISSAIALMRQDMAAGLKGEKSDQDMIQTFLDPSSITSKKKSIIVIDAGGTNFRSCLVNFEKNAEVQITDFEKASMPGIEKELSKDEFFQQIASNISHLKNKSDQICFCFSYPMTITKDQDGRLIGFTKEVKAPEVHGALIGAELKKVLVKQEWNENVKIRLLNDTVSALLAGTGTTEYSSHIGFILGTGMNAAYVQNECEDFPGLNKQIIVLECAKFAGIKQSSFDIELDAKSVMPGTAKLEKMCSGAYLGTISLIAIKKACEKELFSEELKKQLLKIETLPMFDVDSFMYKKDETQTALNALKTIATPEDISILTELIDAILDRAARLAAAVIGACILQGNEGKSAEKPVCVLCNGTTFFKTYKLKERTEKYLKEEIESKGRYYKLISKENDITIGTAMAGMAD